MRETDPERQVGEVVRRFDLLGSVAPFHRCMRCNGLLEAVSKEAVEDRLEPLTRQHYDEFKRCSGCGRVYWRGSHYYRMQQLIARVLSAEP